MAQNPDLETNVWLTWKTAIPFLGKPCRSSNFSLLDTEWNLEFTFGDYPMGYAVCLHQTSTAGHLHKEFEVTTFVRHPKYNWEPLLSQHTTVKNTNAVLWKGYDKNELFETIPWFYVYGELKIDCLFHDVPPSMHQTKNERIHLSSQNDLDIPASVDVLPDLESLSLDFCNLLEDKDFPDVTLICGGRIGIQACLDVPPNLESLSHDLCNLLEHETLPDVKLRCGGSTISCHRSILAARSEVFAAMFRSEMAENETGIVDVTDMDAAVLDLFLKYVYSGKLPDLTEDTARSLYTVGDKYAVHTLKQSCSGWMVGGLTKENCLGFLTLADAHSDEDFKNVVIDFVVGHLRALSSESLSRFKKEHLRLSLEVFERHFAKEVSTQSSHPEK